MLVAVLLFLIQNSRGSRTISSWVTVQATDEMGIARRKRMAVCSPRDGIALL
jgi:hypothetical protein